MTDLQPLAGPVGLIYYIRWKYAQHLLSSSTVVGNVLTEQKTLYNRSHFVYRDLDDEWFSWEVQDGKVY